MEKQSLFTEEQRDEIKTLMHEALVDFFASKGIIAKNLIYSAAGIMGALAVIGGAIKWIAGIFGIGFIMKQ